MGSGQACRTSQVRAISYYSCLPNFVEQACVYLSFDQPQPATVIFQSLGICCACRDFAAAAKHYSACQHLCKGKRAPSFYPESLLMLLCFPVTEMGLLIYLYSILAGTGMETKEGDHTQQPLVILCANCERDAEISAVAASAKVEGLQLFEGCVSLCSNAQAYRGRAA